MPKITRLLIANRGEIACRIMRTACQMGIHTIAIHSEADAAARHVREADEAHLVGPSPVQESYLRMGRILSIAKAAKAGAIHPGYGFLSENAEFAELTREAGMEFVGPPADAIRAMGLKDRAKALMIDAGVPVVPGYHGENQTADFLKRKAYEIGYPVLIKAVAGGGGKGMRMVSRALEFDAALDAARREALAAFGNDDVLVERFVANPRHVEIQVFADGQGNAVHLGERDCSLQRRHQKVIEEAPAPGMGEDVRAAMGKAACEAALAVGYKGAGTVEFIMDGSNGLQADSFYFMEMNTRLQVEHPVTEMITGIDLVEMQLRVAQGEALPVTQDGIRLNGHAVEARIYAENPAEGFLPSVGLLHSAQFETVDHGHGGPRERVDSGVAAGDEITPYYDPMIAKAICWGTTRDEAMDGLTAMLERSRIAGPETNVPFLVNLLEHEEFRAGNFDTGLIDRNLDGLIDRPDLDERFLLEPLRLLLMPGSGASSDPWQSTDGFQLVGQREFTVSVLINGEQRDLRIRFTSKGLSLQSDNGSWVEAPDTHPFCLTTSDGVLLVQEGWQWSIALPTHGLDEGEGGGSGGGAVRIPMHGRIVSLTVADGDTVEQGDMLFSVEAMKMEHPVLATADGTIDGLAIEVGQQVESGSLALSIAATDGEST